MYLYIFMYHHHNFLPSALRSSSQYKCHGNGTFICFAPFKCVYARRVYFCTNTHTDASINEKLHYQVNLRLSTYPRAAPVQNASCCARYREKFRPTRNTPGKTCQKLHSNNCKCINAQFRINATQHTHILVKQ